MFNLLSLDRDTSNTSALDYFTHSFYKVKLLINFHLQRPLKFLFLWFSLQTLYSHFHIESLNNLFETISKIWMQTLPLLRTFSNFSVGTTTRNTTPISLCRRVYGKLTLKHSKVLNTEWCYVEAQVFTAQLTELKCAELVKLQKWKRLGK